MKPALPDVEQRLSRLADPLRPVVNGETALVGIYTGGVWVAEWLHRALAIGVPLGTLDVSFYRDDYGVIGLHSQTRPSEIPFDVDGCHIVLVDDVLYTGRTIRAAMNELFDYGRPASIRLAALIDRGGRELPISAEFVGARMEVPAQQLFSLEQTGDGGLALHAKPWKRAE